MTVRTYFTLLTNENAADQKPFWGPQFGDRNKKVVQQEVIDSYKHLKKAQVMIITTNGSPKQLEAVLASLNA